MDAPYWQNEQAFQAAVESAAQQATQNVAATHRRRLVLSGGLVGFIVACVVAIPTSIGLTQSQLSDRFSGEQHNRQVNCALITKLAGAAKEESQEASASATEFKANSTSRLGLTPEKFDKLVKAGQERRERHLRAVEEVAHHNCNE